MVRSRILMSIAFLGYAAFDYVYAAEGRFIKDGHRCKTQEELNFAGLQVVEISSELTSINFETNPEAYDKCNEICSDVYEDNVYLKRDLGDVTCCSLVNTKVSTKEKYGDPYSETNSIYDCKFVVYKWDQPYPNTEFITNVPSTCTSGKKAPENLSAGVVVNKEVTDDSKKVPQVKEAFDYVYASENFPGHRCKAQAELDDGLEIAKNWLHTFWVDLDDEDACPYQTCNTMCSNAYNESESFVSLGYATCCSLTLVNTGEDDKEYQWNFTVYNSNLDPEKKYEDANFTTQTILPGSEENLSAGVVITPDCTTQVPQVKKE